MIQTIDKKEISKHEMRVQIIKNPEKNAIIKSKHSSLPFNIEWSFGWNSILGLVNIMSNSETKNDKFNAFFASAHIGVILEYNATNKSKYMKILTGHRKSITSIDANTDGRWLVTAGRGSNSLLVIWDSVHRTPIFTLLSKFKMGIVIVKFSVDSRYVISVSADTNDEQSIDLWDWKSGAEEPICSTRLDSNFDPVIHLTNSYDNPRFFCFTTKKLVFFMTQEKDSNELTIYVPKQGPNHLKFNYTQSAYLTNYRQVVSASTGGLVTVWDDINYKELFIKNIPVTNNKLFLKSIKLDEHCITTILCQKDLIIGNTNGDIFFYDKSLTILYHLNKFVGDAITSIAMVNYYAIHNNKVICTLKSYNDSVTTSEFCVNKLQLGIDYTFPKGFKCDPFFISTRSGKIFQVDIIEDKYSQIFEQCEEESITAIDVHPKRSILILGNSIGKLSMYDYQTKTVYNTDKVRDINRDSQVTCIKYSFNGLYLCYGCADGSFWFIHPEYLTPVINAPYHWNEDTPVQHITFSRSSNYVVYTDGLFGVYLYGIQSTAEINVKYYGCFEVHTKAIRGIITKEYKNNLKIYSIGADHKIAILDFDKTKDEHPKLVKIMKTVHEPMCMLRSTSKISDQLIVSGSDLGITLWDDNRCVRTTLGVNLESPICTMTESSDDKSYIFFCNNTDIGILRRPIDGNPYKNVAVLGSGSKLIDIRISSDNKYLFSISEDSTSVLIWSINTRYLDRLEKLGGKGLKAYSTLFEGGIDGSEIKLFKEYFSCVQLAISPNPDTVVRQRFVDVCQISYLMRVMGYYPSESELSNMLYEMNIRNEEKLGHSITVMTFEEVAILYLNYKPKSKLKFSELHQAFECLVQNDRLINSFGEQDILTRESFINAMNNLGETMSFNEMEIVFHTLMKTINDISTNSNENLNSIHAVLPFTFNFKEFITDLFGFQYDE